MIAWVGLMLFLYSDPAYSCDNVSSKMDVIHLLCHSFKCSSIRLLFGSPWEEDFSFEDLDTKSQFVSFQPPKSLEGIQPSVIAFVNVESDQFQNVLGSLTHLQMRHSLLAILSSDPSRNARHYFAQVSRRLSPRLIAFHVDTSNDTFRTTQVLGSADDTNFQVKVK